jgi:hypothetical protein
MIRRLTFTAVFALLGFASLIVWSSIDTYLCSLYANLCRPRPGICAGIDACAADAHMVIGLALLILGPPIAFGTLGFWLSRRLPNALALVSALLLAFVLHWAITFVATRVIIL